MQTIQEYLCKRQRSSNKFKQPKMHFKYGKNIIIPKLLLLRNSFWKSWTIFITIPWKKNMLIIRKIGNILQLIFISVVMLQCWLLIKFVANALNKIRCSKLCLLLVPSCALRWFQVALGTLMHWSLVLSCTWTLNALILFQAT